MGLNMNREIELMEKMSSFRRRHVGIAGSCPGSKKLPVASPKPTGQKVLMLYLLHNRLPYTKKTLPPLLATDFSPHSVRIAVINNGSNNDTLQYLKTLKDPKMILINTGRNMNIGKAYNQGLKLRRPREYIFRGANDFIFTKKGWLNELLEAFNYLPNAGQVGHRFKDWRYKNPNGRPKIQSMGKATVTKLPKQDAWEVIGIPGVALYSPMVWNRLGKFYDSSAIARFAGLEPSERIKIMGLKNYMIKVSEGSACEHIERMPSEFPEDQVRASYKQHWGEYSKMIEDYIAGRRTIYLGKP